jgi:archaellum component FlaD/FlaE
VPHFNIGDILERGRSTKLKENSETAEEKIKTLQAVTTQIGEDEEDEDEDEEDEAEIEEENEDNQEDEENVTDVEEPDEAEDDVEDDNEDTDDDSFINPIVHQLSMQRPPFFAAASRLANHYENEFEIPAPQNLNDFVPLRY